MGSHTALVAEHLPAWGTRGREVSQDDRSPITRAPDALDLAAAEDRVLVAAFLAGSQDAFSVIMSRHQRTVYQVCYRFVRNHEDAADLAQDVFVRAFKGLKQFKGDSSLGTWLYRVGVNCCLNRIAMKRPRTESID
ncbi:MAG: sigma-70 family RNA polymerase sigma factor, partial [Vicinamibacterales bacterium]